MVESLYAALGVTEDAEAEAIHRAYRERVKESHPDVTDDPAAARTFKRLTTARDVLTDDAERALYDRLGHETYVARHLESALWETAGRRGRRASARSKSVVRRRAGDADAGGASTTRHRNEGVEYGDRATWLGEDWDGPRQRPGPRRGGAAGEASWQTASAAYRSTPGPIRTDEPSLLAKARTVAGRLGPWIAVHVAFVGSALATGWFTYAQTGGVIRFTLPTMVVAAVLFALVLALSVLHIVSLVYS